jgi:hypothetical protein
LSGAGSGCRLVCDFVLVVFGQQATLSKEEDELRN